MKQIAVVGVVLAAIGVAVAAPGLSPRSSAPATTALPAAAANAPVAVQKGDTPMRERIATLGLLNKRNGLSRDLKMRPGEAVRIGDVVVRLRACETTADWEADQLTGAFVQVIVRGADDRWRRYFSGWLFRESPSLNAVEHPIYDVWAKDCTMRHADIGPDTVTVGGSSSGAEGKRSSARKSPTSPEDAPLTAPETAASSNAI